MGKFSGVLLAADYDETLVAHDGSFPARNAEALAYYTAEGGRFTLATGRGHAPVGRLVSRLPINAPVIETNGTRIYDFAAGRELFAITMPPEIRQIVARLLKEYPELCIECFAGDDIFSERPNFASEDHEHRIQQVIPERAMETIPLPWTKLLLLEHHDYLVPLRDRLLAEYGDRYEIMFSMPDYLEIFPKGCSKGAALRKLGELLNLRHEDVYAVGDGDNDVSMLHDAGDSFCCANGSDAARAAAGHIVCSCDDGAIGDVIDWLDRKY